MRAPCKNSTKLLSFTPNCYYFFIHSNKEFTYIQLDSLRISYFLSIRYLQTISLFVYWMCVLTVSCSLTRIRWVPHWTNSHGKLKLANSCWQTHYKLVVVNGTKTVGKLLATNITCEGTILPTFWSLPIRVCQFKFAVWRPLTRYKSCNKVYKQSPVPCNFYLFLVSSSS